MSKLTICVIGCGEAGKQLIEAFSKYYNVIAFDMFESWMPGSQFTTAPEEIRDADVFCIADIEDLQYAINTVEDLAGSDATVIIDRPDARLELLKPLHEFGAKCGVVTTKKIVTGYDSVSVDFIRNIYLTCKMA